MKDYKLTIELVPSSCWYENVRSNVTQIKWNILRNKCYKLANHKCEICGDTGTNQGVKHKVECHEVWHYDDKQKIQKLVGLIALCPLCHKSKHAGLAMIKGEIELVILNLMKVNKMSSEEASEYISKSFKKWEERSKHQWTLDIEFLKTY